MPAPPDQLQMQRLPSALAGWVDHAYLPVADGRLGLLKVDEAFAAAAPGSAGAAWDSARIRLSCIDDRGKADTLVVKPGLSFPIFDRFADGRWLVVGRRTWDDAANALIFGEDGTLLSKLAVGDAISRAVCLPDGRAWFGYFDEGIFGNERMGGATHPAHSGLAAYDTDGRCCWQFASPEYDIADCYALGASGSTVWACTYTDFPILRIEAGQVRLWQNKITGAHAIAASGDHVILAGGYGPERKRVVLLQLTHDAAEPVASFHWPSPNIEAVGGCDGVLHAVGDGCWFRLSVEEWADSIARR